MQTTIYNQKKLILLTALFLSGCLCLFALTTLADAECRTEGMGSPELNWLHCYPTPDDYTLSDFSVFADYRLYPDTWPWKVGLTYNPYYGALPYGASGADNYHYSENDQDGPVIFSGSTWGQKPLEAAESSCMEFAYHIDEGSVLQYGSHHIVYSTYDWAGCWPKKVIGPDGYLVLATELDPYLIGWDQLQECGHRYGLGTVYAEKFKDHEGPDFIPSETRYCCRGTAIDLADHCCVWDDHYVEHVVARDEEGNCETINGCDPDPIMGPCEMNECLENDDDCELTVVSAELFKEIGPIREFPCPPEPCQLIPGIPSFPLGCGLTRIPILQPCCSYHEGLRLDIVYDDCDEETPPQKTSIPLHFGGSGEGKKDGGDITPIPTECVDYVSVNNETTAVTADPEGTTVLGLGPDTMLGIESYLETVEYIADDECIVEENLDENYDVMICRCPDLTDSGFCIKKIPKGEQSTESQFMSIPSLLPQPSAPSEPAMTLHVIPGDRAGDGPLQVTEVCKIGDLDMSTDDLEELLDWICDTDHGEYDSDENNCGTMHDKILKKLNIDHDNICKPDPGKCGKCILSASDIADQNCGGDSVPPIGFDTTN